MRPASSCIALVTVLLSAATAAAGPMAPAPHLSQRVAVADTIVTGKVVSIEEKTVQALPHVGAPEKAEYQVAVVKVDDPILKAKGLTHVRVGFLPNNPAFRRTAPVTLAKDQEVCLFLQPHADANFLVATMYYDIIDKKTNTNFEKEVAEVKRLGKLLSDPKAGLAAKDAADRYATATMLLTQYRATRSGGPPKDEPIDTEMSKQILTALAEADWTNAVANPPRLHPVLLFQSLELTEKDGWKPPPRDYDKFLAAAKKWCKDNADTYRVKRRVYEPNDKK
jgi:hypothetical protein